LQDRILVFHRGVGTEKLSGLLIDQKLDLLMDYTVFNLLDKVKQPLEGLLAKIGLVKKKTEEEEKVRSVWRTLYLIGDVGVMLSRLLHAAAESRCWQRLASSRRRQKRRRR
jgi:hypothetical protein